MATAYMTYGFLGAGKTSLARQLEQDLPAIRFTHDEWMAILFGRDPPEAQFAECFARVDRLLDTVWPRCLGLGLDVVLDLNFWSRSRRDAVRALVAATGGRARLYHVPVDPEAAWERIERRNRDPVASLHIARNTFEVLRGRIEPLGDDEPHETVDPDAGEFSLAKKLS